MIGLVRRIPKNNKYFIKFIRRNSSKHHAKDSKNYQQHSVRVAVVGGDTLTGMATSFLLKQNPLVTGIFLQGTPKVLEIAEDLKCFDTRSRVAGFCNKDSYGDAITAADIVLILSAQNTQGIIRAEQKFQNEAKRVVEVAEACCVFAPRSIIVVNVAPVSYTVPLVREVFLRTPWYHPGKVFGATGVFQSQLNCLVARHQDLDPVSVNVPLLGGPDVDCLVPLFSRATPASLSPYEAQMLLRKFRQLPDDADVVKTPVRFFIDMCPWSEAHALNRLVTAVGRGLCSDVDALGCAFVRSNFIPSVKHMMCTVKFGISGVVHNYGVPKLTTLEMNLLERALLIIGDRERKAARYYKTLLEKREEEMRKQKKLEEKKARESMMMMLDDFPEPVCRIKKEDVECKVT